LTIQFFIVAFCDTLLMPHIKIVFMFVDTKNTAFRASRHNGKFVTWTDSETNFYFV